MAGNGGAFFDGLPEDDEHAFLVYSQKVREDVVRVDNDGDPMPDSVILYRSRLVQATDVFSLSDQMLAVVTREIERNFGEAKAYLSAVDGLYDLKMLRESRKKFSEVFDAVEISSEYKDHIRLLVNKIKERIDTVDIGIEKRESLFAKLNTFLKELDSDRTRLSALTAAFVQVSGAVGEAAEKLEPAIGLFERIMKAIGHGSKEMRGLPKTEEELKRLPPPEQIDE
ncbi:hypothetical protein E2F50_06785 [Rhizobium deserti]|uniref:Uncharacterized protein n=1 Tax=Rhizobium deserti TaxID=2547961 RepID=A0A4R5UIH1_9HYPH|nr:hypothetical protein [Rhizobium deserti]TDK36627.1 hypothetical protein E2F50_06785 [Rhizobium deserti]